jgi:predicted TIM-barrel fold metal-dependent hydrolase
MIYEELIKHDPEANCAMFRAFNRWLLDDWGFDHQGRIFAAPYLTFADPQWAIEELEWALDNGARLIVTRPSAPTTVTGRLSPFDATFDGFWARLNEAGIPLVVHAGDSGVSSDGYAVDGFAATFRGGWKPTLKNFAIEKAVNDYLLSMVLENQFGKFPNLRVASVENGAEFLPDLFRKLRSVDKKMRGYFTEDPVEIFKRHIWINPFWEDDLTSVVEWVGGDRVLFGSDWPHIEGLPEPREYVRETKRLTDDDRQRVLHDNAMELLTPAPA